MIKILVTGSNGQLGNELKEICKNFNYSCLFTDIDKLDVTDENSIKSTILTFKPNWIINCAAYTNVDNAETNIEITNKINIEAPFLLSTICNQNSIRMIHISTDYVFDGKNYKPYNETDKTNPNGVYAVSKEKGEKIVLKNGYKPIIIRTSWLYSCYGSNFVKTILKLAKQNKELSVINDQIGTPTYAADLALIILKLIENNSKSGIYNYSNEGICSWYDFANAIVKFFKLNCNIKPISTVKYNNKTPRPYYSVLNKDKIKETLNINILHWQESLVNCLKKMNINEL